MSGMQIAAIALGCTVGVLVLAIVGFALFFYL